MNSPPPGEPAHVGALLLSSAVDLGDIEAADRCWTEDIYAVVVEAYDPNASLCPGLLEEADAARRAWFHVLTGSPRRDAWTLEWRSLEGLPTQSVVPAGDTDLLDLKFRTWRKAIERQVVASDPSALLARLREKLLEAVSDRDALRTVLAQVIRERDETCNALELAEQRVLELEALLAATEATSCTRDESEKRRKAKHLAPLAGVVIAGCLGVAGGWNAANITGEATVEAARIQAEATVRNTELTARVEVFNAAMSRPGADPIRSLAEAEQIAGRLRTVCD